MEIMIPETAVGEVASVPVGVGNIWEDELTLEDGTKVTAVRASLYAMGDTPETDFKVRVQVGQEVSFGGQRVRVTSIVELPDRPGSITLELLE